MIWLTGDTHFYHANIIRYTCRPFLDVSDMARVLCSNWNELVSSNDVVYVLGDFAMARGHEDEVRGTFDTLRGRKRLLKGNHDKRFVLDLPWETIGNEEVVDGVILRHEGEKYAGLDVPVFCSHVHDVWKMRGNALNVGVDVWHFRPVAFDQALEYWKYRYEYYRRTGRDA